MLVIRKLAKKLGIYFIDNTMLLSTEIFSLKFYSVTFEASG